jgi:hypothetical protein
LRKAHQEIAALDAPVSLPDVMPCLASQRIETSNFGHDEVEVHVPAMTKVVIG